MAGRVERRPALAELRVISSDHTLREIDIDNASVDDRAYTKRIMASMLSALSTHMCYVKVLSIIDPELPEKCWTKIGRFAAKSDTLERVNITTEALPIGPALGAVVQELTGLDRHYAIRFNAATNTTQISISLERL